MQETGNFLFNVFLLELVICKLINGMNGLLKDFLV